MHKSANRRFWIVVSATFALILAAAYVSLTNGTFDLSVKEVLKTLIRLDPVREHDLVIFDFRLPRIVIGLLVGLGLGIAGTVVQGVTRNALADPGMLGISAGAGAAVVLFMFFFQGNMLKTGWLAVMAMPFFGLIGGLAAAGAVFLFAWQQGRLDPQRLLLVGIAVGSGFGAITLYVSLKMDPDDFEMAAVWLKGSIYNANWRFITAMLPWLVLLIPFLWRKAHVLNLLQLEENSAAGIGLNVNRQRLILLLGSIGLVSACVSVSGSIGFVGLIAPHIARRLVGVDHRLMLPVSGLVGMAMVTVAGFIGRTVFAPAELSVGIVISIIGVPYFISLLLKERRQR